MRSGTSKTLLPSTSFGYNSMGALKSVMLHIPGRELELVKGDNCSKYMFKSVPDSKQYRKDLMNLKTFFQNRGIVVHELSDLVSLNNEMINYLPCITRVHDTAVITDHGAIVSSMAHEGRRDEQVVIREALQRLNIPLLYEFDDPLDAFEGCMIISDSTLLVMNTAFHSESSNWKLIPGALNYFDEVLYIDIGGSARFSHPYRLFNKVSNHLVLAYLPALHKSFRIDRYGTERIDLSSYLKFKGVETVELSEQEYKNMGCCFIALEEGVIVHHPHALEKNTLKELQKRGVQMVFFQPEAILAGGGSLRSHTLRLLRGNEC
ncbi:hypothetical protein QA601_05815 [Chitinispirillales bacterium ANBcel5]|uniref:arginine deiminase n=1 Tax=Cellulosispirillum alkaliphilum TaxID=3039283 RepID=UPI002A523779|nr:hypothetical protein [Chitinispirillales bacterium ANBcel5]